MEHRIKVDIWKLSDLCTPWCVHVVATLRIANHIEAGVDEITSLARASGADSDYLHRILRHLVEHGLFEEPSPGHFNLNEPALQLLRSDINLGLDLDGVGGRMAYAWSSLLRAVQTGSPAYETIFGRPFWEDLAAHPEIAASFDELMGPKGHGIPDPNVLITGEWDSVGNVVDVGGGTGSLLAEILRAHPKVRGVLVDLPATIARSSKVFRDAGVTERVSVVAQSFFDALPAGADLYLLKSVLSDWPDADAIRILKRCAEAARPHGRVVILNGVSPDEGTGPSPDLLMMVLVGGRERPLTEFRELARSAGLEVCATKRLQSARFVVECRPIH